MEDRGISLRVLDNINIKFIDMDPMNGDSRLNIETHLVKIKKNVWGTWVIDWNICQKRHTEKELEMSDITPLNVDEGI